MNMLDNKTVVVAGGTGNVGSFIVVSDKAADTHGKSIRLKSMEQLQKNGIELQ